jgi:Fe-S-cluster-containing hydrogenase component 2
MADNRTITGSRDDLVVDTSRCLRMRFSESSCRHCVDICPHGAVILDGGLAINPEQCHGCLLCTTVCPAGALEQNSDFSACLAKLSKVYEPVLGCIRTNENSNGTMACLGGLSEEHLLTLCHSLHGELILNLTFCSECPNCAIVHQLRRRLSVLSGGRLLDGGCRIGIVESERDIHFRDESIGRRGFFKSLRSSLFQGATVILSAGNKLPERRADYSGKRVQARREMLNLIRENLHPEVENRVRDFFDTQFSCEDNCTACQGCVAICPAGALLTSSTDDPPHFESTNCTGCGLCAEFCIDGAVKLTGGGK